MIKFKFKIKRITKAESLRFAKLLGYTAKEARLLHKKPIIMPSFENDSVFVSDHIWLDNLLKPTEIIESSCRGFLGYKSSHI